MRASTRSHAHALKQCVRAPHSMVCVCARRMKTSHALAAGGWAAGTHARARALATTNGNQIRINNIFVCILFAGQYYENTLSLHVLVWGIAMDRLNKSARSAHPSQAFNTSTRSALSNTRYYDASVFVCASALAVIQIKRATVTRTTTSSAETCSPVRVTPANGQQYPSAQRVSHTHTQQHRQFGHYVCYVCACVCV